MSSKTAFIKFIQKMPRRSLVANRAFALCLVMLFLSGSLLAQGYVQQTGAANPFAGIDVPNYSDPAFADLDSDGDLDLVLGASSSVVYYYQNTGTPSAPVFTQAGNLFTPDPTPRSANFYPTLGDVDGDGKLDAVIGNGDGILLFYKNTGTITGPAFTQQAAAANPFAGIDIGGFAAPNLGDLDGDGDLDLIVSDNIVGGGGVKAYYRNTGTRTAPVYVQQTGSNDPLSTLPGLARPVLGDIDKDGDLDIVSGTGREGRLLCFLNIGTVTAPVFTDRTDLLSNFYIEFTFNGRNFPDQTLPGLADLDGDGDLDLAVGGFLGTLVYLKNVVQITRQPVPVSVSACSGSNVSTTIQTSGDGTRTYQWYRNSRTTTTPVPGQTGVTLNLNGVQAGDAGLYFVLVGGAGVSIWSQPFTLTVGATPSTPNVTVTQPTCSAATGTITINNSTGTGITYSINGNTYQASNIFNNVAPGNYNVTAKNSGGCTSSPLPVTITSQPATPAAPTVTASGPTTYCDGGSVSLSAPLGFASYLWSNGATTRTITVDQSGSYTVRVTNSNGCTSPASAPIVVTENQVPQITTILVSQPDCLNTVGLIVVVLYTDFGGITYSIDGINYQARPSFSNVAPGTYSVTARSSAGCVSRIFTVTINQGPPIPATPTITVVQPTCTIPTGTITVNTPTGSGITYSINGTNYQQSNIFRNVAPGNYLVRIKDINFECASFAVPTTINAAPAVLAAPVVNITQPTCTVATGTITVNTPTGADITYSINGSSYQTSNIFNNVTPGNYNVTAKNSSGCTSVTATTINPQPATPAVPTVSVTQPTCTVATGTITVNTPTGAGLTYSINGTNYQSGNVFSNLPASSYSVTVKNNNGCVSAVAPATVNSQPATPAAPIVDVTQPSCTVATGTITVSNPTGSGITYSINNTAYQNSNVFNNVVSGNYQVTAKNSNSCTSSITSITINPQPATPAKPVITVSGPTTFCAGGSIILTAPTAASYQWSNGATSQSITVTQNGSYMVTITNTSGCTSLPSDAATVTVNPLPAKPVVTASGPTTINQGDNVTLTAPAGFASYLWSNGATMQSITVGTTGSYTVVVTNNNGCNSPASDPVVVTLYQNPVIFVTVSGAGSKNGLNWANAIANNQLQASMNTATGGSQFWVKTGTYYPTEYPAGCSNCNTERDRSFFLKNNIALYGGFAGNESTLTQRSITANPTILSGNIGNANSTADNSYHVVISISNNATAILDGVSILSGNANGYGERNFMWVSGQGISQSSGAGMYNYQSAPSILNCTISQNSSSSSGAGMLNRASSPTITNCAFTLNNSNYDGGGMASQPGSAPVITNSRFVSNTASGNGGGIYNNATITVSGSLFQQNSSYAGGGIANYSATARITATAFDRNNANNGGGVYNIYSASSIAITNSTFSSNTSNNGGAIYNSSSSPTIVNSTFYTTATNGSRTLYNSNSNPTISNSIIRSSSGNGAGIDNQSSSTNISYSLVQGGWGGTGNSSADPLFVNAANPAGADGVLGTADDGLKLQAGSPAVNTGNNAALPAGTTIDITGAARIQGGTVDMGAYENGSAQPPIARSSNGAASAPAVAGVVTTAPNQAAQELTVKLLQNPVTGNEVQVLITGAKGKTLTLQLADEAGKLLTQRQVKQAGAAEYQWLPVPDHAAQILYLRVSTGEAYRIVKIVKAHSF